MKIGLTGASGLLGHAVAESLHGSGHEVIAIRHRSAVPPTCTEARAALTDPDALERVWEGVDGIVHLAAVFSGTQDELKSLNVDATHAVAQCAESLGARLVVAGSAVVYAAGEMIDADETRERAPTDAYAWSKHMAEEALPGHAAVLRLPSLIGRAACPVRDMLTSVVRGMPLPKPESGGAPIELAPVRDVAEAVRRMLGCPSAHGPYNVSGATRPRFVEIVEAVAEAIQVAPNWAPLDAVDPAIRLQATEERTLSIERARRELGYAPTEDWREVLFGTRL